MTEPLPRPARSCVACAAPHYVAVRFCPFCGAAQPEPAAPEPSPRPPIEPPRPPPPRPAPAVPYPDAPARAQTADPPPPPSPAEPPRPGAPTPAPSLAPVPGAARGPRPSGSRWRLTPRRLVLAAAAITVLALLATARRDALPPVGRIAVGPGWTAVDLAPYRAAPLLRLTGDGAFALRLDGDRLLRVAPGSGASLRLRTLRGLEARSGRGPVTLTLTPRRE